jgi:spore coat polysaccharide biosynthesis predicted glycosyltransferase SpsG
VADASGIPACQPPLLLLDSYRLEAASVRKRTGAARLALMHDEGPLPAIAELIVTSDPQVVGTRAGIVGGPDLAPLGPGFWGLPAPAEPAPEVRRVLVTTGGGDPAGHAVGLARAVSQAVPRAEVLLVRGPHADFPDPPGVTVLDRPASLLEPLIAADLALTAAGNSLLEAAAVGTPTVGVVLAENQRAIARGLADQGATELFPPDAQEPLVTAIRALAASPDTRRERARRGRALVDGYGALRIAFLLARLLEDG